MMLKMMRMVMMMILDVHDTGRDCSVGVQVGSELDLVDTRRLSHSDHHRGS